MFFLKKPSLVLSLSNQGPGHNEQSLIIVAVYQPQLYSTHRCLCVCLSVLVSVCLSVCVHDNSKNNGSIHLKLEHIVV